MSKSRMEQIVAMLADEPNDPELHYMLAMEHVSANDDPGAVRCFEELFQRAPDYVAGYHMAGRTLARLGRLDEARAVLQRGIPVAQKKNDMHAAGEMQEFLASLE